MGREKTKSPSYLSLLLIGCFLYSCSSGEYELDKYTINYTETTLKIDTLPKTGISEISGTESIEKPPAGYVFVVQIGAFFVKENYDRFLSKARELLGNDVYDVFANNLYKIRIGSFTERGEAERLLEKVRRLGYSDAFVITTKK